MPGKEMKRLSAPFCGGNMSGTSVWKVAGTAGDIHYSVPIIFSCRIFLEAPCPLGLYQRVFITPDWIYLHARHFHAIADRSPIHYPLPDVWEASETFPTNFTLKLATKTISETLKSRQHSSQLNVPWLLRIICGSFSDANCLWFVQRGELLFVVRSATRIVCGTFSDSNCLWYVQRRELFVVRSATRIVCGTFSDANCLWFVQRGKLFVVRSATRIVCGSLNDANCLWFVQRGLLFVVRSATRIVCGSFSEAVSKSTSTGTNFEGNGRGIIEMFSPAVSGKG
jgi:hypothetical protein